MSVISSERIASIEARKHELQQAMSRGDLSPEEFVRHGEQGHCVAVPIEVVPGMIQRWAGMPSPEMVREQERLIRRSASFWEAVILQEPAFCPEGIEELRKVVEFRRRVL